MSRTRAVVRRGSVAVAIGVAAALGLSTPAFAADANLDPNAPVSLTIHKYETPDAGNLGANDGSEIANPTGNPLAGVEFTVQPITTIDLTTNEGWAAAEGLTVEEVALDPAAYPLGDALVGTTDATGTLTFATPDLAVGLYLVQETNTGSNQVVAPAQPFLVALPQPGTAGTWNYDVHVYPKNSLSTVVKSVDDEAAFELGDIVDWTITTEVPTLPSGTEYTEYVVADSLDARLGFASATVTLIDGTPAVLTEGIDYALTAPAAGTTGDVTMTMLQAGLDRLGAASPSATVSMTLGTSVLEIGDGTITNDATLFVNDPSRARGITSNVVDTQWGALQIVKHAEGDLAAVLEGAVFSLYNADPATGAEPIETGLTTDDLGQINLELKAGDYWLVETQAPAGYELDATPIPVTVVTGSVATAEVVTVANSQVPAYMLPLTGGSGAMAFTIGGLALVLVAGGLLLVMQRRRAASTNAE